MSLIGCVLMAAITFPVSYYLARGCLRGLFRVFRMGTVGTVAEPRYRSVL